MTYSTRRTVLKGIGATCAVVASPPGVRAMEGIVTHGQPEEGRDIFVDPDDGNDDWRGDRSEPNEGSSGPLATLGEALARAFETAAELEEADDGRDFVNVWLRGGRYRRTEPLTVEPHGTSIHVRFLAYPDEQPVVDGSREIKGWEETTVNGVTAWKTTVEAVAEGEWAFRQLFVDGQRRHRPRLPKAVDEVFDDGAMVTDGEERFYHFQSGTEQGRSKDVRSFVPESDSIDMNWRNLQDIDVVTINKWYDERAPIETVETDGESVTEVTTAFRPYHGKQWQGRFYYVENVFEALSEPGEFYLDRETGECYYVPHEDESIGEVTVTAPRARHLLRVEGQPADDGGDDSVQPVEFVHFDGIDFAHTTWEYWRRPDDWGTGQSALPTVGAVVFRHARDCTFSGCTVRTVGEYALDVRRNVKRLAVVANELADVGAGGIKMGSYRSMSDVPTAETGINRITDNHIHDTGRVFHLGAGILALDTYDNVIAHNHIHDLYYTGISVGFSWGFADSPADANLIRGNYVHDIGKGLLSDLGGVYTLGVQPATAVRNNYIHDVHENDYGGWGLYPDEGSTGIRWSRNLVHDVENGLHLHYGGNNTVQNNILAGNRGAAIAYSNGNTGGATFGLRVHNNVLVTDGAPIFTGGYDWSLDDFGVNSDSNLLWDRSRPIDAVPGTPQELKIVRAADGTDVSGAVATVDLSAGESGTFRFATLSEPVTLEANTRYRVVTKTTDGGPKWYDPVDVETAAGAAVVGGTYYSESDESGFTESEDGRSFGPLNVKYRIGDGDERTFVTDADLDASLRNDHEGYVGMTIEVGDDPIEITALGRLVPPTWWETWREQQRDTNSVIADPRFEDPESDDYQLRSGSPARDPPVNFRPLDLSGVGPREEIPPAPPAGVTATDTGELTVAIEWNARAGAAGYRVARGTDDGGPYEVVAERSDPGYVDELDGTGWYYYVVTAVGPDGVESHPSIQAAVRVEGESGGETGEDGRGITFSNGSDSGNESREDFRSFPTQVGGGQNPDGGSSNNELVAISGAALLVGTGVAVWRLVRGGERGE